MIKRFSENSKDFESCKYIFPFFTLLYLLICLRKIISVAGFNEYLKDPTQLKVLVDLWVFPHYTRQIVHFIPQSANDYFIDIKGSLKIFLPGKEEENCSIIIQCLHVFSFNLKQHLCNLKMPGIFWVSQWRSIKIFQLKFNKNNVIGLIIFVKLVLPLTDFVMIEKFPYSSRKIFLLARSPQLYKYSALLSCHIR